VDGTYNEINVLTVLDELLLNIVRHIDIRQVETRLLYFNSGDTGSAGNIFAIVSYETGSL